MLCRLPALRPAAVHGFLQAVRIPQKLYMDLKVVEPDRYETDESGDHLWFVASQSPRLRADATARVAAAVAAAYETVHSAVADPANGYSGQPGFAAALEHSPEQVRTILGVLG